MRAKKNFGQNFLNSKSIIDRIIELINPEDGMPIVEIGPGLGALTIPLAKSRVNILAVELERAAYKAITKLTSEFDNVSVINADFLSLTTNDIEFNQFKLVGNLPYNITSPIIDWSIKNSDRISSALFMVQLEVARRITSGPGNKDWSPLAIFTQLCYDARFCFEVKPEHFSPPPKVTSAIIRLDSKDEIILDNKPRFENLIRSAFKQRRKQLLNNLVPGYAATSGQVLAAFDKLGVPKNIRAEQLSIEQFIGLDRLLV